MDNLA
jgi:fructose-bisphosphate aldolase class I